VSADQVARHEFVAAADGFERKIRRHAPRHVAFLGKVAYAALTRQREVDWGLQSEPFGGATAWVLPNPSGLNRAFGLADLVTAYRKLRIAAERTPARKAP
jgi:TDG/mug DNA glycosylase family protein